MALKTEWQTQPSPSCCFSLRWSFHNGAPFALCCFIIPDIIGKRSIPSPHIAQALAEATVLLWSLSFSYRKGSKTFHPCSKAEYRTVPWKLLIKKSCCWTAFLWIRAVSNFPSRWQFPIHSVSAMALFLFYVTCWFIFLCGMKAELGLPLQSLTTAQHISDHAVIILLFTFTCVKAGSLGPTVALLGSALTFELLSQTLPSP